jgi:glycine cleavage system H protein
MIPDDLRYTTDHEWVRRTGDVARIGITDFAQQALGDIVYVSPPELGTAITAGATLGEIESTKSVSDVYAPVAGEVIGRNDALDEQPELINSDPYGAGWLAEIRVDPAQEQALLTAAEYAAHVEQQG